ncbi:MAG TPA: YibE/F family protein, partial [Mycobacterium sp.]|nr:YibE/F family protein [Mycobacterium sp.]
ANVVADGEVGLAGATTEFQKGVGALVRSRLNRDQRLHALPAAPVPAAEDGGQCVQTLISIESGPNKGADTLLEFSGGPGQPNLAVGDDVRVSRQVDQTGVTTYSFYDYERAWPLTALAAAFAIVVVAVAGWRGLRALIGIVIAFGVLVVFMLPALRDGAAAIPVALVASAVILYAVIYLAHGVSLRTSAALLGTLTSLLLAAVLSWGAIELAHLTGLSEDQNNEVAAYLGNVSITGLLLAGFIIGSLGVLNDVTVTQASTAFELAQLEGSSRRAIFLGAMRVGRDHIASTVYTLVLAYAGSALPLLLLFSVANRSLGDVLTSESVAIEIARSAVGGIALALSVPLTTGIAAVLATPSSTGDIAHRRRSAENADYGRHGR